ncbi:MAG: YibE/F family protein [Solirubrobacterales bacterium]
MGDRVSLKTGFTIAVIAVSVITAIAMVLLWPSGDSPFKAGPTSGKTEEGQIQSLANEPCDDPLPGDCLTAEVEITSGAEEGKVVDVTLSSGGPVPDYDIGNKVRVNRVEFTPDQFSSPGVPRVQYTVFDFERRAPLLVLFLIFAALVIAFGRLRGALSLVGLGLSLAVVLVFIVPAILDGSSPLAVAIVGSMAVMLLSISLAHGVGPKSLAAIVGTGFSLLLVGLIAVIATNAIHLTGMATEETTTLALTDDSISLSGLLIAGMIIGALGVLDDVTISQASTVFAIRSADPDQGFVDLYRRAIDVGRDHVSATVNTLVLAYVGSSLPILLIFGSGSLGLVEAFNLEIISKEIVAMLVGSIGLIAAVPITTALAALMARSMSDEESADAAEGGHHHGHAPERTGSVEATGGESVLRPREKQRKFFR